MIQGTIFQNNRENFNQNTSKKDNINDCNNH